MESEIKEIIEVEMDVMKFMALTLEERKWKTIRNHKAQEMEYLKEPPKNESTRVTPWL